MPVTINNFTYTNGNSGRTRVNEQGLIVGVDFSTTSNTIATGSKTFTLTATANVNRDWPVGSTLVAVAQAGATGSMIGTVTSYDPATQVLVMNVASITGSGTSTDWRIGSTMVRELNGVYDFRTYNPLTMQPAGLIEGGATEFLRNNLLQGAVSGTPGTQPTNWNLNASGGSIVSVSSNPIFPGQNSIRVLCPSGNRHIFSQSVTGTGPLVLRLDVEIIQAIPPNQICLLNPGAIQYSVNNVVVANPNANLSPGRYTIDLVGSVVGTTGASFGTGVNSNLAAAGEVIFHQVELQSGGAKTSFIPTTTVAVTRAADQLSIGGTNFSQFYNSAQGTLVMELTPIAQAVGAVAGSLNDGTANNAIRIQQKQSGTLSSIRKMATDGVTDVMAINASTGNTLRSNGVDYIETPDQSGAAKLGVASSGVANFLSVGAAENFRNTTDSGLTYNARTIGGTFGGAHFGIGRFVVAGSTSVINGATVGSVIVSADGLAFRRVNILGLPQQLNEITSNGTNQYVAVGNGGVIYTSPDAETWTPQTSGTANNITGVSFFSGRYVAATTFSSGSAIRYSDDGTTWVAATASTTTSMIDVAHNGTDLWVVVGGGGTIFTSSDGISYTSRTSNVATTLRGIHFADSLWVAVGDAGTVVTSPDGITWTDRTANSGTTQNINEVGFFNGKFYYVGNAQAAGENTAANIVANVTWTARTSNVGSNLNGIATNGSRLLICGSSGAIATSADGTTFTSRTGNATQLNGAAFGAGTYVIVGNAINGSGLIATVNPTTFEYQRRVSGTTNSINGVKFLNGAFYALVNGGTSGLLRSTDGNSYSPITTVNAQFRDIAFSGSRYVAVANANDAVTSTDGLTFTNMLDFAPLTNGVTTATTWLGIEFANGLFVTVGTGGAIAWSTTGAAGTWSTVASGTTQILYTVMYSTRDNQWYAAGDGGVILRSADAITWTSIANDATVGIFTAGALQANPLAGKFIPNVKNRVAIGWTSTGGVSISINGGDVVTDPSVTMPVLTQYSVGMNGVSGNHWNSTIKTQRAYRVRVSDEELKALSRI